MATKFVWDAARRRYVFAASGAVVTTALLHTWVEEVTLRAAQEARRDAEDYFAGKIAFSQWVERLTKTVREENQVIAVVAYGGIYQMNDALWRRVDATIGFHQSKLTEFFTRVVVGGKTPAQHAANAALYAIAGWPTFQQHVRMRERDAGLLFERRVRVNDKRACDDCKAQADLGWSAIGTLRDIGDCACGVACRCYFIFRMSSPS